MAQAKAEADQSTERAIEAAFNWVRSQKIFARLLRHAIFSVERLTIRPSTVARGFRPLAKRDYKPHWRIFAYSLMVDKAYRVVRSATKSIPNSQ